MLREWVNTNIYIYIHSDDAKEILIVAHAKKVNIFTYTGLHQWPEQFYDRPIASEKLYKYYGMCCHMMNKPYI